MFFFVKVNYFFQFSNRHQLRKIMKVPITLKRMVQTKWMMTMTMDFPIKMMIRMSIQTNPMVLMTWKKFLSTHQTQQMFLQYCSSDTQKRNLLNRTLLLQRPIPRDDGPPSKKKRSELTKPPTSQELNAMKETENLFHSNLFKLQVI